ncbi:MAG: hypothetical protein FWE80_01230 [Oscillospiraceae bacterium]|nr:hypothetical protein [Oscillospiraceae bacterium]
MLRRKSKNRFMLYYHRPHIRNSFIRVLFAKAEQTPTGVSITATLRMFLPVYIFLTVWFSGVLFGFITSLLASELLGIIITGLMLTTGILLTKLAKGKPERVLSLMDDICKI